MKKLSFDFTFPLISLILIVILLNKPILSVPALGKLLNPFIGAVQNERLNKIKMVTEMSQLGAVVDVYFDERNVPHVFSKNDSDMFFSQGYITASDRLWQMDFLSYAAAGRFSEIFGDTYLTYDRTQRRLGIYEAARTSLKFIERDIETKTALDSYTKGVNSYISKLVSSTLPFEYKLMNYAPEPWTNLKSVLIMKYIAAILTGYEEDVPMSRMYLALGDKAFRQLFPEQALSPLDTLSISAFCYLKTLPYKDCIDYSFLSADPVVKPSAYNPRLGSNSWAVSGAKTKSGKPILCSDPHLNLNYPSIWYEVQLSSNDMSVYGVSIPGVPSVIIGFNKNVAWGITNGATDARDWYKLKIKDDYSEYGVGHKWLPTRKLIERIKIRAQRDFLDTIYQTVYGPIVIDKNFTQTPEVTGFALKWTLHEPSDEFLTFIHLNKARSYPDFVQAIRSFKSPNLNFLFASSQGDIAIHHQGLIYDRLPGQGRFILDGSDSGAIGQVMIGDEKLPHQLNPLCGYVYSANNYPWFGADPIYLTGYYSEARANRIRWLLDSGNDWTTEKMEKIQLDNTNQLAKIALPILMNLLKGRKLNDSTGILKRLQTWDCEYNSDDRLAFYFEQWWKEIKTNTWDELERYPFYVRSPDDFVLLDLMKRDPSNRYFDILGTEREENAGDIVSDAFNDVAGGVGSKAMTSWGDINKVKIMHLSGLEALSDTNIRSGGTSQAINATSDTWGPSWRMVVELGDRPTAYGILPGSQSGNPADKSYKKSVEDWVGGKYYKLNYFVNPQEAIRHSKYTWTFKTVK